MVQAAARIASWNHTDIITVLSSPHEDYLIRMAGAKVLADDEREAWEPGSS